MLSIRASMKWTYDSLRDTQYFITFYEPVFSQKVRLSVTEFKCIEQRPFAHINALIGRQL